MTIIVMGFLGVFSLMVFGGFTVQVLASMNGWSFTFCLLVMLFLNRHRFFRYYRRAVQRK